MQQIIKIVAANKSSCCKLSDRKVCACIDRKRRTQYSCKEVKDRPTRTTNVVFVVALNCQLPSSYIFALKHVFCRIWSEVLNCFQHRRGWFFIRPVDSRLPSTSFKDLVVLGYMLYRKAIVSLNFFVFVLAPISGSSQRWPLTTTFPYLI